MFGVANLFFFQSYRRKIFGGPLDPTPLLVNKGLMSSLDYL